MLHKNEIVYYYNTEKLHRRLCLTTPSYLAYWGKRNDKSNPDRLKIKTEELRLAAEAPLTLLQWIRKKVFGQEICLEVKHICTRFTMWKLHRVDKTQQLIPTVNEEALLGAKIREKRYTVEYQERSCIECGKIERIKEEPL